MSTDRSEAQVQESAIKQDTWVQFATLILERSNQHILALDNRIYYVLASDTAIVLLLGGGMAVPTAGLPMLPQLAPAIPILLSGISLLLGVRALRPKVAGQLAADGQRPPGLHMFSSEIAKRGRQEYVVGLLGIDDELVRIEMAQYIYDLQLLLRAKSRYLDGALAAFKLSLVASIVCLALLVFTRGLR